MCVCEGFAAPGVPGGTQAARDAQLCSQRCSRRQHTTLAGCRQLWALLRCVLTVWHSSCPAAVGVLPQPVYTTLQKHPELQLFCNDWTYVRYLRARWVWRRLASSGSSRPGQQLIDRCPQSTHRPAQVKPASNPTPSHTQRTAGRAAPSSRLVRVGLGGAPSCTATERGLGRPCCQRTRTHTHMHTHASVGFGSGLLTVPAPAAHVVVPAAAGAGTCTRLTRCWQQHCSGERG